MRNWSRRKKRFFTLEFQVKGHFSENMEISKCTKDLLLLILTCSTIVFTALWLLRSQYLNTILLSIFSFKFKFVKSASSYFVCAKLMIWLMIFFRKKVKKEKWRQTNLKITVHPLLVWGKKCRTENLFNLQNNKNKFDNFYSIFDFRVCYIVMLCFSC